MQRVNRVLLRVQIFSGWYGRPQQLRSGSPLHEQRENQIPASAVVVPKAIFVQVGLQTLLAYRVVNPA